MKRVALKTRLSRKEIIVIAVAVAAVILGLTLIYIQLANLRTLRSERENEEFMLNQSRSQLQRLQEYRDNAPFYQDRIAALRVLIPEQPEEEQILRYFSTLAEDYDLALSEIRFDGRVASEEGYVTMPLTVVLEGRYRQMVGFLNYLRHGERAIRVDNISIALSMPEEAKIRVNLNANAFYRGSEVSREESIEESPAE
jgi:Tfp pilus assembly protein PilO